MDDECWVVDDSCEGYKDGLPLNVWELEDLLYGFFRPWDELAMIFSKYEETGFGEMSIERFRWALYESEFRSAIVNLSDIQALQRLEMRTLNPAPVTYQEFVDIVSNKRRRSFNVAVHHRDREVISLSEDYRAMDAKHLPDRRSKLAFRIADEFLPGGDDQIKKYYSLQYRCWPPPLFIPLLTALQIAFFMYYSLSSETMPDTNSPVPIDSILVYRSDKRIELWRFLLYSLVHAGWWHLVFNLMVQVLIGLPLEMVHGSPQIALVYLAGVLAGSLATSVFDPDVYLVGASGGVYALLAAHVANVFLNYSHIDCGFFWILTSILIASLDVSFAIWDRYVRTSSHDHPVSYLAHLAGAIAGLTLGFLVLKSFDQRLKHQCLWWFALGVYSLLMSAAVVCNLVVL